MSKPDESVSEFESSAKEKRPGILRELVEFLGQNKKYWMIPLVVLLLAIALLVILGGSAAAPFIYTLF
ncbi:MAG: DUF5989 family protein [Verrucomicrobiota bacterium]